MHHCWLYSFPGYPANTGPAWTTVLLYGHFAVVVFIVLSGFSLAASPATKGWELGGARRFARRRAWRILPPYWAALVGSLVIAWTVIPIPGEGMPTARSVVVNGLLLQDIIGAPSPNGNFWSIAVEAQLYVVFPILLLMVRRAGAVAMIATVTAIVVGIGLLAPISTTVDLLLRLTPQFAALFALGVLAAGVLSARHRVQRTRWLLLAALAAAPVVALIVINGTVWTVREFYWIDLAFGPSIGFLLAAVASGRPKLLVRVLDLRPVRSLGTFSYSLYLIHAPIVGIVSAKLLAGRVSPGVPMFLTMLAVAVPLSVGVARVFAAVFEIPFQRHRSRAALWAAFRNTVARGRRWPRAASSRGDATVAPTRISPARPMATPAHPARPALRVEDPTEAHYLRASETRTR
jgi:peptidoglycan/LPS O-acetylase OafA/YrhL